MRRTVLFLCLLMPVAARADGFDWLLRPNGWGWSNGYHAANNCVKVGVHQWAPIQNADWSQSYGEPWIPTCRGCSSPSQYGQPMPAAPVVEQVPTPAKRSPVPPMKSGPMGPMNGPMMNGPMKNTTPPPDQEASRQTWWPFRY